MPEIAITRASVARGGRGFAPVKARPVQLHRRMAAQDAFRFTLLECLAQTTANVPVVVLGRDVEGLHQLRVALRRLQVALRAFGDAFGAPVLLELKTRAKYFSRAVAPARDLDVLIEEMLAPMVEQTGLEAVETLRARAGIIRAKAWDAAVDAISSTEFAGFLEDVAAAAEMPPGSHVYAVPVKKFARASMDDFLALARKRAKHFKSLEPTERHRLRVALKHLRYAAEFYAPLYKKKKVERYLGRLEKLQDGLGVLNDAALFDGIVARLAEDAPDGFGSAARQVEDWQRAHIARLHKKMHRTWTKFRRQKPFWE